MKLHINRPRIAALALARAIGHLFPVPRRCEWRLCMPWDDAEKLRKNPPRLWKELLAKNPSPEIEMLLSRVDDLTELRKQLRACRRLASKVVAQGSAGVEYATLFKQLRPSEFVKFVVLDDEPREHPEEKDVYYIWCDVHVKPPVAIIADQMAETAKGIRAVKKPTTSPRRVGRPRTVTPALWNEAQELHARCGTWEKATDELNRRHQQNDPK